MVENGHFSRHHPFLAIPRVASKWALVLPHLRCLCKFHCATQYFQFFEDYLVAKFPLPKPRRVFALGASFALGQAAASLNADLCTLPSIQLLSYFPIKKDESSRCFCYNHGLKQMKIWYFLRINPGQKQIAFLFFS